MLPFEVKEFKPGLIPAEFHIPAVKKIGDFNLLVIERCHHPVYLDETRPRLVVPDPSDMVADSVVMDLKKSIALGYEPGISEPGIDWVSGEFTDDEEGKRQLAAQHAGVLKKMERLQHVWFQRLVDIADDDFNKYKMRKLITNVQRVAAMTLGIKNREWLIESELEEIMSKCKFCFTQIHPEASICFNCHGDQTKDQYVNVTQVVSNPIAKAQANQAQK